MTEGPTYKELDIEPDHKNTEKVKPTQISPSIISDFYVSLFYWKEETASQN